MALSKKQQNLDKCAKIVHRMNQMIKRYELNEFERLYVGNLIFEMAKGELAAKVRRRKLKHEDRDRLVNSAISTSLFSLSIKKILS